MDYETLIPGDKLLIIDKGGSPFITSAITEVRESSSDPVERVIFFSDILHPISSVNCIGVTAKLLQDSEVKLYRSADLCRIKGREIVLGQPLHTGGARIAKIVKDREANLLTVGFEYGAPEVYGLDHPDNWPFVPVRLQKLDISLNGGDPKVGEVLEVDLAACTIVWTGFFIEGSADIFEYKTSFSPSDWEKGTRFSIHTEESYEVQKEIERYPRPVEPEAPCSHCDHGDLIPGQELDHSVLDNSVGMSAREYRLHLIRNGERVSKGSDYEI